MLHDPLHLRNGVRAKNRIWLAPMTNQQSHPDGSLSDDELRWLDRRARGGFGVVETCAAHVALDGQGWPGELGVYDDALLSGLTRLASAMHARGALVFAQIFHGGARASEAVTGQVPWSATELALPGGERARRGTTEEVTRVVGDFARAAARAQAAGFDGVELHGAHGYLLCQFLSAMNTRTDGWGGAFEGRARLAREVTRAVRAAVKPGFVVGVRLSPEDFGNAKGMDLDESIQTARWLAEDGADFIHVSLWNAAQNTKKRPAEHPVSLFRAALPRGVTLVAAGAIWTRADAEALLERGADAVAVGRAAIANPDWARDVETAGWEPRRPPLTVAELTERALSPAFAGYMRNFKGFVVD